MTKKLTAVLLILAALLMMLPAALAADQVLEVWYAVSGASGEAFVRLANAWDEAHDGVTLNLSYSGSASDTSTKVSAGLLSGTEPDVALMYAGSLYTGERGDWRVEDWIAQGLIDQSDVYEGIWAYCKFGGHICALPYGISTQVVYYNKDVVEGAGVDMSNPPQSWDELLDVLRQIMSFYQAGGNADMTGFEVSDPAWLLKSMLMQNGCEVVEAAEDGSITPVFNNEKGVEVAEYWRSLVTEGVMEAGKHSNAEDKFLAGNCAFIAASSNRLSRWSGNGMNVGAIEMPSFGEKSVALGGNVLVVFSKDEPVTDFAADFAISMFRAENQTAFAMETGYLPTHISAMETEAVRAAIASDPMYAVAFAQLDYAWSYTHFSAMGTMDALLWTALNEIEKGAKSPQDAMDKAVKKLISEFDNE